ncbi:hypothetical protein GGI07_004373 [Coemansia sp. Benny D115]|nr:hypothetical protein GGI07_004373 [Coemansia sp. Benny D115]
MPAERADMAYMADDDKETSSMEFATDNAHGSSSAGSWRRTWRLHTFDPRRVSSSRFLSTGALLALRTTLFAYTLTVWVISIVLDILDHQMQGHFVYFTHLCYTGLLAYLGTALVYTLHTWRYPGSVGSFTGMPRVLQLMHWLLFGSALLFATIVSLVFWIVLYKPESYPDATRRWITISVHGANLAFMWVEMAAGAMVFSPHWLHPTVLAFLVALYLALAYINEAVNGWFTYDFIDYKVHKGMEAAIIVGILAGIFVLYYVLYAIHRVLDRYLPPRFARQKPLGKLPGAYEGGGEYSAMMTKA